MISPINQPPVPPKLPGISAHLFVIAMQLRAEKHLVGEIEFNKRHPSMAYGGGKAFKDVLEGKRNGQ